MERQNQPLATLRYGEGQIFSNLQGGKMTKIMLAGMLPMPFIFQAAGHAFHKGHPLAGWIGLGAFVVSFLIALKGVWELKKDG